MSNLTGKQSAVETERQSALVREPCRGFHAQIAGVLHFVAGHRSRTALGSGCAGTIFPLITMQQWTPAVLTVNCVKSGDSELRSSFFGHGSKQGYAPGTPVEAAADAV